MFYLFKKIFIKSLKNDELKVKVPLKVVYLQIIGKQHFYNEQITTRYIGVVHFSNGISVDSDYDYQSFTWSVVQGRQYFTGGDIEDDGTAQISTPQIDGDFAQISCKYKDNATSITLEQYLTLYAHTPTYEYSHAELIKEKTENGFDYYYVTIYAYAKYGGGPQTLVSFNITDSLDLNGLSVSLSWDILNHGLWDGGYPTVPIGSTIRVQLNVNSSFIGYLNG